MSGHWPFRWLRKSAAQWFVRLRAQPVTPQQDVKFQRWLDSDPENEADYERQELVWELAGELAEDEEIESLVAEAERATEKPRPAVSPILMWSATAAVLVVAVCISVYWQWPSKAEVYETAVGAQRTVVLPDQSNREHRAVIDAIRQRDWHQARARHAKHRARPTAEILKLL